MLRHVLPPLILAIAVMMTTAGPARAQDPRAQELAASPNFRSTVAGFSDIEYLGYLRYIISLAADQGSLSSTFVALRDQGVPAEHTCFVTRIVLQEDLGINVSDRGNQFAHYVLGAAGC